MLTELAGVFRAARRRLCSRWRGLFEQPGGHTAEPREVAAYREAARRRLRAGESLESNGANVAALVLYREALLLLARAFLFAADPRREGTPLDPGAGPDRGARLDPGAALERVRAELTRRGLRPDWSLEGKASLLVDGDALTPDRLGAAQARLALSELRPAVEGLLGLLERGPRREGRRVQVVALAFSLLVISAAAGLIWRRAHPPRNLALNAPVTATSRAFRTAPQGAVDGYRYGQLGFHSDREDSPRLTIDLGGFYLLSHVDVYGRGDCCFDQSLPLAFEVSDDGESYRLVAQRTREFSQFNPWIIRRERVIARYLRLRSVRPDSVLVVNEVEAYGREAPGPASSATAAPKP